MKRHPKLDMFDSPTNPAVEGVPKPKMPWD